MAKTIADIKPIAEGSSDHFYKKSALGKYVEEPVLKVQLTSSVSASPKLVSVAKPAFRVTV